MQRGLVRTRLPIAGQSGVGPPYLAAFTLVAAVGVCWSSDKRGGSQVMTVSFALLEQIH